MEQELILYASNDGKSRVSLLARDGSVWLNQSQLAELFATSIPNISQHINNILKDRELRPDSVIKNYLTTATNGKINAGEHVENHFPDAGKMVSLDSDIERYSRCEITCR